MSVATDYKELRINHNNLWPLGDVNYPCEQELKKLMEERNGLFTSFNFPKIEEKFFQKNLSYILDALDNLPLRPDLAFDNIWKAIDNYMQRISQSNNWDIRKSKPLMKRTIEEIWIPLLNTNIKLKEALNSFVAIIPIQTCEYLAKRAIADNKPGVSDNQQGLIKERVSDSLGKKLYEAILKKYENFDDKQQRKCGRFFHKLILGNKMELDGKNFKLNDKEVVLLILKGILYTYRNERFHGETFSPFRSSASSLKTYAHAYFLFLYAYFLLLLLIHSENSNEIELELIVDNIRKNTDFFENVFKNIIDK